MTSYKETLQETKIGRDSISQGEYAVRMSHIICRTQGKMKMQGLLFIKQPPYSMPLKAWNFFLSSVVFFLICYDGFYLLLNVSPSKNN